MKIEKLYTLSQFVDLLKDQTPNFASPMSELTYFVVVAKYNDFLKQPLKKQMFVNDAEKKVIFRDFSFEHCDDLIYAVINKKNGHSLDFYNDGEIYYYDTNGDEIMVATLHDLAEATNGELELKNVEL